MAKTKSLASKLVQWKKNNNAIVIGFMGVEQGKRNEVIIAKVTISKAMGLFHPLSFVRCLS